MFNTKINLALIVSLLIPFSSAFGIGGEYGGRFNTGLLSYSMGSWYWNPMPTDCSQYDTTGHPAASTGVKFWCGSGPIGYSQGFNFINYANLFPDDKTCSVNIAFYQYAAASGYEMKVDSGTIVGMTKSGNKFYSTSGSMKCRDYLLQGGISWGYFDNLGVRGPAIWQNYQFSNSIRAILNVSWSGGEYSFNAATWPLSSSPNNIPPVPASCTVNMPSELQHGVVDSDSHSDVTSEIQISCNKTASISMSFMNGTMPLILSLGGNVVSTVCFTRENDCVSGLSYNLSGNSSYTALIRSRLSGTGWVPGSYEGNVIIFLSYQ